MITCPDCNGTGEGNWQLFNIITRKAVDCTREEYLAAPIDEDMAFYLDKECCRLSCTCLTCKGEGEIPEDY